ncbi:ferruginol synthase-like isoform X1 [Papaver somniferum]|uniref:ferruginol synthase-like isoform X1 n=2 Tax=Papaver somniferum TaxID=3469 RepID=UPI000E6F5F9B|nr:ferruginol synthase-like isoform X1 [Papaver somniferum]
MASMAKQGGYIIGENSIIFAMVSAVLIIVISCWYSFGNGKSRRNGELQLPPGPRGLPLIGSLLSCGSDLHTYFGKLAETYGPVIKVKMGSKIYVVISSASMAKEVLKDNDSILAYRDTPIAALVSSYGGSDIAWSPSNSEWRKLRKVLAHELLSKRSLESCYDLRREEIRKTIIEIYKLKISMPINFGEEVFVTILNVITGMLWGGTIQGEQRSRVDALEFRKVIVELNTLVGKPNVSDFFPVLRCFDIQGIERQATALSAWLDCKIDLVIDHKEKLKDKDQFQTCQSKENRKDFVQLLLELMEQEDDERQINSTQLKALFVDIVMAGTDATSTTIEWVMTEMMQHPEIMKRVQAELDQVVGINNMVEESHLSELQYLNAVLKETLRLHPAAPLLLPHSSSSPCQIGGYIIPNGVTVLCNAWSIHRDPEVWADPLKFHPERFSSNEDVKKFDYNGNNFIYIPFGSGRRICSGIPLAKRMLPYVLASLLHSFDWRLPKDAKLDLRETFGVALKKTTPLVVIPTPRLDNLELYT